ncbi:hypothetical protein R3P38DRAFT_3233779 [Favolaschia claudopus]|uniref:Uncharacterized protein n=1 Tax=Favolaschia claudopus TaxID=2862362 RepID=A0AAV9ZHR3_9AGAR
MRLWDDIPDLDERDDSGLERLETIMNLSREARLFDVRKKSTNSGLSSTTTSGHSTRSTTAVDGANSTSSSRTKTTSINSCSERRQSSEITRRGDKDVEQGRAKLKEKMSKESIETDSGEFSGRSSVVHISIPPTTRPASSIHSPESIPPAHRVRSCSPAALTHTRRSPAAVASSSAPTIPSRSPTSTSTPPAPCTLPPSCPLRLPDPNSSPQRIASKLHDARAVPRLYSPSDRAPRIPSSPAVTCSSTHTPLQPAAALPSLRAAAPSESPALPAAVRLSTPPVNLPLPLVLTGVRKDSAMQQAPPPRRPAPVASHAVSAPPPRPSFHRLDVPPPSPSAAALIPAPAAVLPAALPQHRSTPCRARVEKSPPRYHLSGRSRRSSCSSPPLLGRCGSVEIRPISPSVRKTGKDPPWRVDANPANAVRSRGGYGVFRASASGFPPPR